MKTMSKTMFAITATAGALTAAEFKDIRKTLPLEAHGRVTLENYKGSIRVSTWDRNEVDIAVRIEEDGGPFAQSINRADVRIDSSASDVRMESRDQWFFFLDGVAPTYHYTVRMPRTASLRIKDYKSETEVRDLSADLDVDTYKGEVQVRNHNGGLMLNTYKGEVRADFSGFPSRSSFETYKGRIDVRLPRDARFDLRTDLGRRADLDSDFTRFVNSSGSRDRTTRGAVNGGGPELRLKSYKGDLRLRAN